MPLKSSIPELIERAKIAAKIIGIEATGRHRAEPGKKRQFEVRNLSTGELKWARLGHLEFGSNPWRVATVDDQLERVKKYAKELGLVSTGNQRRKSNARYFEVMHPDGRTKYATLRNLQDKKNPFLKQTLEEQIQTAKAASKPRGLKVTGNYDLQGKGNRKIFEVVTNSGRSVYMNLNAIRAGFAPRISKEEQLNLAKQYALDIGISVTGKVKRGNSGQHLFEVTNGEDVTFAQLSHLKLGQNPWNAAFKINKNGYFYVYEIIYIGEKFIGFGVTNNYQRRHSDHLISCRGKDIKIKRIQLIQMHGEKCLRLETTIKRMVKLYKHVDVTGFRTESAPYTESLLRKILNLAKKINV